MDQKPTVLLLAGGFATRLWPLTEKRAKPLLPLAGKALIQHIIDALPPDLDIIVSTNKRFEEDFQQLQDSYADRKISVFIEDSQDDKSKKGALAATAMVIREYQLESPLFLIAGDNYFGFSVDDFLQSYEGRTLLASYDTQSLQQAKQFGVVSVDGKRLSSFVEKPVDPPSTLISTGCYLFEPGHLEDICTYSEIAADNLGGIFEHLLQKDADIDVFTFSEDWIDIGSFESYLDAHKQLLQENNLHGTSEIINCSLGEAVDIGPDCHIENSELDHVIVMSGTTIKNARLRGCIIDRNCVIEGVDLDRKMIREGTVIKGA
jgi:glucose-1-phosphate thymidylyltransferase